MFGTEFFYVVLMLVTLAVIRFGIPMLVMALIKLSCCRILHLEL
jgi:hypothetical protein